MATRDAALPGARLLAWEMVGYAGSIAEGRAREIGVAPQAEYLHEWLDALELERFTRRLPGLVIGTRCMKPIIVFDVNETLLDMAALDGTFARIFGAGEATEIRQRWFKQVLELFLTGIATDEHRAFGELTRPRSLRVPVRC